MEVLLVAIALSLDCMGAGIAYGLQKIEIDNIICAMIGVCSFLMFALAMVCGKAIEYFVSAEIVQYIGSIILLGLGLCSLGKAAHKNIQKKNLFEISLDRWGVIIRIIRKPDEADLDRSGNISWKEALYLALALSFDVFGVGVTVALLGFPIAFSSFMVGISACFFLMFGKLLGVRLANNIGYEQLAYIPGAILCMLALIRLMDIG